MQQYQGGLPLAHFLKGYFKQHPKLGSRDRRILSEMAYCWYRVSKAFDDESDFHKRLDACLYLCETSVLQILSLLPPEYQNKPSLSRDERWKVLAEAGMIYLNYNAIDFIPVLSEGVLPFDWLESMQYQPSLFIRIIKDQARVLAILKENEIKYETHPIHYEKADRTLVDSFCLSFKNGTPIDKLLSPDSYVVQDISSQQTGKYFKPGTNEQWLDCCSGAGGKSLLLKFIEPKTILSVSDTRETIIRNLKERFKQYALAAPATYIADARDQAALTKNFGTKKFDNIICDVPCTGSGTWTRTPEQLYYFKQEQIKEYADRQKQIAANMLRYLKPGGRLIYITCSVFAAENEEVLDYLINEKQVTVHEKELINGISQQADCLFVAVLSK